MLCTIWYAFKKLSLRQSLCSMISIFASKLLGVVSVILSSNSSSKSKVSTLIEFISEIDSDCPYVPECPWMFLNVPECPWMSLNVPECPWMSLNVPECPWMSLNVPECPWMSLKVPIVLDCPWMSLNVPKCPWLLLIYQCCDINIC